MIQEIHLDIDCNHFLNADYSQHYGSCISYQVREQKDLHVGGFPKSYTEDNTRIQQLWWDHFPLSGKDLGMEIITVSTILQPPGNTVTCHRDTFFQINKRYPNDPRKKVRANIYLEDWKPGHLIHYQDENKEWQSSTYWRAGDGFIWDSDHLHLSGNCGLEDKYTLQVSGFVI